MSNNLTMQEFNSRFKIGDKVKHFKQVLLSLDDAIAGKYTYEILGIGEHTSGGELCVIYKSLDNESKVWIRPMKEFCSRISQVKYPYSVQEYRFEVM